MASIARALILRNPSSHSPTAPAQLEPRAASVVAVEQDNAQRLMHLFAAVDRQVLNPSRLSSSRDMEPALAAAREYANGAFGAAGRESILAKTAAHRAAIEESGIGLFYGVGSAFMRMSDQEKDAWLAAHRRTGAPSKHPKRSSCLDWALIHLRAAYAAAGQAARFREIENAMLTSASKGLTLALELHKDLWQGVYFSCDTMAEAWAKDGAYRGLSLAAQVVDYRPDDATAPLDLSAYRVLETIPFFFGLARNAEHAFVGHDGIVSEFHFDAMPSDPAAIEESPLIASAYSSGVLLVPPDSWRAA